MTSDQTYYGAASLAIIVRELYAEGQTDYSIEPLVLADPTGQPKGRVKDGDTVIFCCRRGEREIQLTEAFTGIGFDRFPRPNYKNLTFIPLTLYHDKFKNLPVAFAPGRIETTLGELVSQAGMKQLRVSESEKFAHVTFFFSGGRNQPFTGEEAVCVPSPKGTPFDQVPQLSLPEVAAHVKKGIEDHIDLIVTNFANGDAIGHTSNNNAKIECARVVDRHLDEIVKKALAEEYVILVTADHGNLEEMFHSDGSPHVSHTTNPVPFVLFDARDPTVIRLNEGKLADIAPTILAALGLEQPGCMTGASLAPGHDWKGRRRVLLIILDGWGIGREDETNPIFLAETPCWDELLRSQANSRLLAAGEAVGLQAGKTGNSEAGHMNIGAGRVILQDDVRLEMAMQDGSFSTNEIFCRAMQGVRLRGSSLHLIGLLSEKSSHGSIDYPLALLKIAKNAGLAKVFLHIIFDGRSTEPGSAPALLENLEAQMREIGLGLVVSGVGRGIALDRDGNYGKTQRAYETFTLGRGRMYRLAEREAA